MEICIDFDGTCVAHEYPRIGKDIGAVTVLQALTKFLGAKLILFTMRSGKELDEAVEWFKDHDIELYGIQTNPTQSRWTDSPKAYGQLYIDDAALGAPLIEEEGYRPYIDWEAVAKHFGIKMVKVQTPD